VRRIPERLSEDSKRRRAKKVKRDKQAFVRGPIPLSWVQEASRLPGKALAVAMAVYYRDGFEGKREPVAITGKLLEGFGVNTKAGYRALAALEQAGLIAVERHRGRCPRVTLIEKAR